MVLEVFPVPQTSYCNVLLCGHLDNKQKKHIHATKSHTKPPSNPMKSRWCTVTPYLDQLLKFGEQFEATSKLSCYFSNFWAYFSMKNTLNLLDFGELWKHNLSINLQEFGIRIPNYWVNPFKKCPNISCFRGKPPPAFWEKRILSWPLPGSSKTKHKP